MYFTLLLSFHAIWIAIVHHPQYTFDISVYQLKSLFPKPDKSTFGTSEKNRFL